MKKFIILWFVILFLIRCSSEQNITNYRMEKDPLINSYQIDSEKIEKQTIKNHLNYFLTKYNRHWSKQNKEKCVDILYKGQKEFNIDHKIVLSIISIESQFNIKAIGKNKKSIDYGLTQQNSKYLKQRYKNAEQYLKEFKIKYTDSNFDIGKNIVSCFVYLHDINEYSDLIQFSDYITAYNQGVKGCKRNNDNRYYEKFMKEYLSI